MTRRSVAPVLVAMIGLVLGCAGAPSQSVLPDGGVRVLFLGNSLTYTNDLPLTIAGLAEQLDETPFVYRTRAFPNYGLEDHWAFSSDADISRDGWQFVVMQQGPSSLPENRENLRRWVAQFDVPIRAAGARSVLYQVWPAKDFVGSFDAVRESYRAAALSVDGMFIPAGEAWQAAWAVDSSYAFYGPDDFHPSELGTYLTALVHFEMFYDRPATDLPDVARVNGRTLDLTPERTAQLQRVAHETVLAWGIR